MTDELASKAAFHAAVIWVTVTGMGFWDDEDLAYLRHNWGGAYVIIHPRRRLWSARRKDDPEGAHLLTAPSADELLELIRSDYNSHPVPR